MAGLESSPLLFQFFRVQTVDGRSHLPISVNNAAKKPVRSQVTTQSTLSTFSDLTADYYRPPILSCEHEDPFRDDHWSTARRHVRSGYVMSGVKNAVGYRAGGAKGTGSGNQHPDTVCDIQTSRHGTHHHGGNPGRRKNTEHRTGHITPSYEPPPPPSLLHDRASTKQQPTRSQ